MPVHDTSPAAHAKFEATQRRVERWVADVRTAHNASAGDHARGAGPSRVPKISRTHLRSAAHPSHPEPPSLCRRRRAPQPYPILVPPPPPPFFASSVASMSTGETLTEDGSLRTPEPLLSASPAGPLSPHMRMSPAPQPAAQATIPVFLVASPSSAPLSPHPAQPDQPEKLPVPPMPHVLVAPSPPLRPISSYNTLPSIRKSRRSPLCMTSPPTTAFRF